MITLRQLLLVAKTVLWYVAITPKNENSLPGFLAYLGTLYPNLVANPRVNGLTLTLGKIPEMAIIRVEVGNYVTVSFNAFCDPQYSAIVSSALVTYFKEDVRISDVFLHRRDGSICYANSPDFFAERKAILDASLAYSTVPPVKIDPGSLN